MCVFQQLNLDLDNPALDDFYLQLKVLNTRVMGVYERKGTF